MEIMEIIETSETLRPRRPHINHVYHAEVVEFQQVPSFWLLFIDSLALVAWLISRLGGRERWQGFGAVAERCEALTLKAIHGGTAFRSQRALGVNPAPNPPPSQP
jgi:hypothetical protein